MEQKTIAWLTASPHVVGAYIENLKFEGVSTEVLTHADEAIKAFKKGRKYDAIVAEFGIDAGFGCQDPMINSDLQDHYGIVLRVVELTRGEDSINQETPIILATSMDLDEYNVEDLKKKCLDAGVTQHHNPLKFGLDDFTKVVMSYMNR